MHVVMMDVNLRGLAVAPLGRLAIVRGLLSLAAPLRAGALTTTKLLPPLKERLLSLHALRPEKIGFGEVVAAIDVGETRLGQRKAGWLGRADRGAAGAAAAERHRPLLELHKIYILLICDKVQAIGPLIFCDGILPEGRRVRPGDSGLDL